MSDFFSILPASLQPIVQDGILAGVFEETLVPMFLYDALADERPWAAQLGAESIMTKAGMMPRNSTPVTGQDATQSNYGFEQYRLFMDQYGSSIDTNMAVSAMALRSKFVEDNKQLGIQAAGSLNEVAQNALYGAFGGGTTWAKGATTASTTLVVNDATGFDKAYTLVASTTGNGEGLNAGQSVKVQPVSASNPLSVKIGGANNTVVGCDLATNTLTLGTAATVADGAAVVSAQGAAQYRPNGRASANQLVAGDTATLSLFRSAVTRLRSQYVPAIGGAYTAHVPSETIDELFADPEFESAYRGRADSPVYKDLALGRFAGIDWVVDDLTPIGTNEGGVSYYRPIVCGAECLIKGPFEEMGNLVSEINAGATVHIEMLGGVARILRAPLDRFGQVLTSTWSWIGGYTVGTDALTERGKPNTGTSSAAYKRAVVLEHA